ncbi:hypothetical protein VUR80DRAFT_9907 [Thermomyces stellatus]
MRKARQRRKSSIRADKGSDNGHGATAPALMDHAESPCQDLRPGAESDATVKPRDGIEKTKAGRSILLLPASYIGGNVCSVVPRPAPVAWLMVPPKPAASIAPGSLSTRASGSNCQASHAGPAGVAWPDAARCSPVRA